MIMTIFIITPVNLGLLYRRGETSTIDPVIVNNLIIDFRI